MPLISLEQAKEMIQTYEGNKALVLKDGYDPNILADSETFSAEEINQILNQEECKSVRIYFGMSADLNVRVILVGVNTNGNDILVTTGPVILEEGTRCPPYCKPDAGLNS